MTDHEPTTTDKREQTVTCTCFIHFTITKSTGSDHKTINASLTDSVSVTHHGATDTLNK